MAKEPILPSRTRTEQTDVSNTRKDQKNYQLPEEYNAQLSNQELDRIHERINKIVVEAEALADLDSATATAADCATRLNAFGEILRNSGLLRRS